MVFLYPQFLLGLLALSIPIIIHLFNFKKTKKIFFSNNQFLKNVKKASSSKLKLKHFLILAARMLFIAFLVLAFAQPFIPSTKEELNNQSVYIYLDNSMSMSNKLNNDQSALDVAVNYINEILNLYPASSQFVLLTNEFNPFSNSLKSAGQIREAITEVNFTGISRSLPDVMNRFNRMESFNLNENDVFILSDFQKSTTGQLDQINFDPKQNYSFIPLTPTQTSNVFIDSLYLTKPFLFEGQTNQLEVSMANSSEEEVKDLIIKLFVNDVQVANASVDIAPNSKNIIKFDLASGLQKQNRCRLSFEEFPVSFDNDFYFALNLANRISIVEIKSSPAGTNIEKVYGNDNIFNFSSYNINNMDYSQIKNADLIILNNLSELTASLTSSLKDFLNSRGHILIIPSENVKTESFDQLVSRVRFSSLQETDTKNLSPPDFANPFYENIFEETNVVLDMPQARRTLNWSANASSLLSFNNGEPFLSEISDVGKIYILGSPLNNSYTNFHKHAIFVPVMYKIASLSKAINERLYYSINESVISIGIDSVAKNEVYKLANLTDQNQELIPNQRSTGADLILELPKNSLEAGYYDLQLKDEGKKILAFNYDKSESILQAYGEIDLEHAFSDLPNVKFYEGDNVTQFTKEIKEAHFGITLWEYALILALFFLLCEILLLRFL